MRSEAENVEEYLAELPKDRQEIIIHLRNLVRQNLPEGYVEAMNWGMICYEVPLQFSGPTYNGKPLMYAAIGAQKHHTSLHLSCIYCQSQMKQRFLDACQQVGIKPDMGKSCLRIKKREHIPDQAIAETIAAMPMNDFIASVSSAAKQQRRQRR